jgi:CMP/dCMP kinase
MRSAPIIITIDGPAASGKTSVSRSLAARHKWSWVSTGAFYRGLAFVANAEGVSLDDENALAKLCLEKFWKVKIDHEQTQVWLHHRDITDNIYREENGAAASSVSRFLKVRENLLQAQRKCAENVKGLVAEGRDCGTVVFPEAKVKFYLTARTTSRAERRAKEQGKSVEEMRSAQVLRDAQDSSREVAPMAVPPNAHVIDTSELNLDGVVDLIDQICRKELEIK